MLLISDTRLFQKILVYQRKCVLAVLSKRSDRKKKWSVCLFIYLCICLVVDKFVSGDRIIEEKWLNDTIACISNTLSFNSENLLRDMSLCITLVYTNRLINYCSFSIYSYIGISRITTLKESIQQEQSKSELVLSSEHENYCKIKSNRLNTD